VTDWCILRTNKRRTLALAESLAKDGFQCWTPAETRMMRVPRANAKREVRLAIIPGFVFAHADHLIDLIQLAGMASKPRRNRDEGDPPSHADFRVMRCFGKIPMIADRDLASLRRIEEKRTPRKRAAYAFPRDALARVTDGPFTGFTGIVAKSNDRKTRLVVVAGGRAIPVEIPTSLLELDEAYQALARKGTAALKAA
jgi:transcription antitermination factor NusG